MYKQRRVIPTMDRLWARVDKTDECWNWTGCLDRKGYGIIGDNAGGANRSYRVHRLVYIDAFGPVDDDIEIDHRCFNRHCVKPEHLRATTTKQNQENRQGASARSKSGIRSVYFDKSRDKWAADISHNGRTVHAGRFDTATEAESAAIALRNALFTHNDMDRVSA